MHKMNCLSCEKEFYFEKNGSQRKFCSLKCAGIKRLFWKNATPEQKRQNMIDHYNKYVIRKEGCWGWSGAQRRKDEPYYAVMSYERKIIPAHRVSWIIHKGNIPDGLWVLHSCDNKTCSNPDHLFLGTVKDNVHDAMKKGLIIPPMADNHHMSKLTSSKVKEIRKLLIDGITQAHIARLYDVTPTMIQGISAGRTWKSVTI